MRLLAFTILKLALFIQCTHSLNILGIFPYNGISHFSQFKVLLRTLAEKGHNVTVISPFPQKTPINNYHDISLADKTEVLVDAVSLESLMWTQIEVIRAVITNGNKQCEVMLSNDEVQRLVKEQTKFEVILYEQFNSDCAIGLAYKLKAPYVAVNSGETPVWLYERWGLSSNPGNIHYHNTFYGRIVFPVLITISDLYYRYIIQAKDQKLIAKYIGEVPHLEALAKQTKLSLTYQNFILSGTRMLPQNIIEVGGYHVPEAKPLKGELKTFIEEAEAGVIYISFGTVVKSSTLSSEKLEVILEIMEEFPQRFIWKWEKKPLAANKSKLYIDDWLPQTDILGHANTLAFFTHAGMGGTTESIFYGVPMLAMPIAADQPFNAKDIVRSGMGVELSYNDLSKDTLRAALNKILDPEFRKQAQKISSAWHDRPTKALETAVFWTEFVARHPDLNFRLVTLDIPLYQRLYLEPLAVFSLTIFLIWLVLKRLMYKYITSCKIPKKKYE